MAQERVIALVDMDCFYVQVEQRRDPSLRGKPCAVVQYKKWQGGGIIAVGYEARAKGVTRQMRGDEAKKKCPEITLVRVPESRGKADLTRYRDAGREVIEVLCKFSRCVERASIDEAYIDLTEEVMKRLEERGPDSVTVDMLSSTHVAGWQTDTAGQSSESEEINLDGRAVGVYQWLDSLRMRDASMYDRRLAVGAAIAEEMRAAVERETGFHCSAGIGHNKVLAKLCCGLHKPKQQTVLPHASVPQLYSTLPIKKVRGCGGKLGASLTEELGVEYMGQLAAFSEKELQAKCGDKCGTWLYNLCRGIDYEAVKDRQVAQSIGCGKNFPGRECLDTKEKVLHWLTQLTSELAERLQKDREMNNRVAKLLVVGFRNDGSPPTSASRSCAIHRYEADQLCKDAFILLKQFNVAGNHQAAWSPAIVTLHLGASKFIEAGGTASGNIATFLSKTPNIKVTTGNQQTKKETTQHEAKEEKRTSGIAAFFSPSQKSPAREVDREIRTTPCTAVQVKTSPANTSSGQVQKVSFFAKFKQSTAEQEGKSREGGIPLTTQCDGTPRKTGFFAAKSSKSSSLSGSAHCPDDTQEDLQGKECDRRSDTSTVSHPWDDVQTQFESYARGTGPNDANGTASNSDSNGEGSLQESTESDGHGCAATSDRCVSVTGDTSCAQVDKEDVMACEKCGKDVLAWELPEHLDFHFAMELQQQQQQQQQTSNGISGGTHPSGSNASKATTGAAKKPGKRRGRPPKRQKMDHPTLDTFFKHRS
ncbi:DNA polymerase eta-like [Branchiostoma floridae]|uniref:DNA polymerase eta n=1 Tax=Branchiostoma floridae TaxID=7739 RepID=A0A9J7LP01_BRAFL|nr:DNA polymerase eta-like [Branchiostoma floridae]